MFMKYVRSVYRQDDRIVIREQLRYSGLSVRSSADAHNVYVVCQSNYNVFN